MVNRYFTFYWDALLPCRCHYHQRHLFRVILILIFVTRPPNDRTTKKEREVNASVDVIVLWRPDGKIYKNHSFIFSQSKCDSRFILLYIKVLFTIRCHRFHLVFASNGTIAVEKL